MGHNWKVAVEEVEGYWWPVCDHKGCYMPAATSRTATIGSNRRPVEVVIENDRYTFCGPHLGVVKHWLANRTKERNVAWRQSGR